MNIDVRDLSPSGCGLLFVTAAVSLIGGVAFFAWIGSLFPNASQLGSALPYVWLPFGLLLFWGSWHVLGRCGFQLVRAPDVVVRQIDAGNLDLYLQCVAKDVQSGFGPRDVDTLLNDVRQLEVGDEVAGSFRVTFDDRTVTLDVTVVRCENNCLEVVVSGPQALASRINDTWQTVFGE